MKTAAFLGLLAVASLSTAGQIIFTGIHLESGPPGTQIVLFGSGFTPGQAHSVTVGARTAQVLDVGSVFIRLTAPADSVTGPVEVVVDGARYVHSIPFTVTRLIEVQIDPAASIPADMYAVGTFYGDAAGGGSSYMVDVAVGEPTLWARAVTRPCPH